MGAGFKQSSWILRILVAIPLGLTAEPSILAQESPSEEASESVLNDDPGPVEELPVTGKRFGSSTSFNFDRDQSMVPRVKIIQELLDRNDALSVLPYLESLLSVPTLHIPLSAGTDVTAFEYVHRVVRNLPIEVRNRFEEQRRVSAQGEWERVRTRGMVEIADFLRQYGDSSVAAEAWWWIGCYERDQGRVQHAAAAFQRSAAHPHAGPVQRAISLVAAYDVLRPTGLVQSIHTVTQSLRELDERLLLEIAGRRLSLGEWLSENLPRDSVSQTGEIDFDQSSGEATWRQIRPVLIPNWKQALPLSSRISVDQLTQLLPDQEASSVPIAIPLVQPPFVFVRTTEAIHAFELETGQPVWKVPNLEYEQIEKRSLLNAAFQRVVIAWAQRRSQADSIFGNMTTDGKRLFVVQEPDRSKELRMDRDSGLESNRIGPRYNQVFAYHLESGHVEWKIGSLETEQDSEAEFNGYFFPGPPLVLDGELFVIAQRQTELELLVLDPENGLLKWSMTIGNVAHPIEDDLLRARTACPIVWSDGLLLCSTGSGGVVAIDPVLRSAKWSYRYPAVTVTSEDWDLFSMPDHGFSGEPWWQSWRIPFMRVARLPSLADPARGTDQSIPAGSQSVLLFASPESEKLHALQLPDGQPLWQCDRSGGLLVAGIAGEFVLVCEDHHLRAHRLDNGLTAWRTDVGAVGGPPVVMDGMVIVPADSGGTIMIDPVNGKELCASSSTGSSLGVLARANQGWISFNRQRVSLLPRLGDVRQSVEKDLIRDPNNESLRVRAALLDLQAGEVTHARKLLQGLESPPARELRRQALIAALENADAKLSGTDRTDLAKELASLADNGDYRFAAAAAIGTAALSVNDLSSAVEACLEGISNPLRDDDFLVKRESSLVRKDRVLLGIIDEAYRRARLSEIETLDQLFRTRLTNARTSRERFALVDLANQWRGLDWGRSLIVTDEEKSIGKRPFVEVELRLRDAIGSHDTMIASLARKRLSLLLEERGNLEDAASVRHQAIFEEQLKHRYENPDAPDTKPGLPEFAERSGLKASLWPESIAEVTSRNERNFNIYCPLLPTHTATGSLIERLDIAVERLGNEVYFRGENFFQAGQTEDEERRFVLPKSFAHYRGPDGNLLRAAWGIGRIVLLQVGSELFAIAPINDRGEPDSRYLWSNPIDLRLPIVDVQEAPAREGIHEYRREILDPSDRVLSSIGPVCGEYFCYRSGGRLVAVETESGRELWQRNYVSPTSVVTGDDHHIYLWGDDGTITTLSAVDGRRINQRKASKTPRMAFHLEGALAWTVTDLDRQQIELENLATGQIVWSHNESMPTMIGWLDDDALAIVTTNRRLRLLSPRTGKPLCDPLEVDSHDATDIAVWQDSQRWYIALSKPIPNLTELQGWQHQQGYRLKFIDGPLYAVDREHHRIVWKRQMKSEPLSLDQPRSAPVFVQAWKSNHGTYVANAEGVIRVIDKRSGKTVVERRGGDVIPYFLLNSDREQGILELKVTRETIRIQFAADEAEADNPGNQRSQKGSSEK